MTEYVIDGGDTISARELYIRLKQGVWTAHDAEEAVWSIETDDGEMFELRRKDDKDGIGSV